MTVTATNNVSVFLGNGVTTEFDCAFRAEDSDHVFVYLITILTGVTETLTLNTDFSLSGIGDEAGFLVTYPIAGSPMAATHKLVVQRLVPYTQETDITSEDGWNPEVIENQLDLMVMQVQQLAEESTRALRVGYGQTGGAVATGQEGQIAISDGAGNIEFRDGISLSLITPTNFMGTAVETWDDADEALVGLGGDAAGVAVFKSAANAPNIVASVAALKALDTTKFTAALLTLAGRAGTFVFRPGDYAAAVASDTLEGVTIKADAIAAAAGAWVRMFDGGITPRWFGAYGDNIVNDATPVQAAFVEAARLNRPVDLTGFIYRCGSNIDWTIGANGPPDVFGSGLTVAAIYFDGVAVTHGLYFNGPTSYDKGAHVRDLRINCVNGAKRGVTWNNNSHAKASRVSVWGADGAGLYFGNTLMASMDDCLVWSCGDATEGEVVVDGGTTFTWKNSRISGSNASTSCGLMVDRIAHCNIVGGAVESAKVLVKVGSKTEAVTAVKDFEMIGVDLENPSTHYIELGYGWTGAASLGVIRPKILGCSGSLSGSTTAVFGIKVKNTIGLVTDFYGPVVAGGTSNVEVEGSNAGYKVLANPAANGSGKPWVRSGASQQIGASPLIDYQVNCNQVIEGYTKTFSAGETNPNPIYTTEGGVPGRIIFTNAAPTTVLHFYFVAPIGMTIALESTNGNTTLQHLYGGLVGEFRMLAGANLVMAANRQYLFRGNGTQWVQLT